MDFPPLVSGTLVRRYKRFLADVMLDTGETITAWCPNPGAMTGCAGAGWRVGLSESDAPKRKLKYTWEVAWSPENAGILVHTGRTNDVAAQALALNRLPALQGYGTCAREVVAAEGSRLDFCLREPGRPDCWVEVKGVTLPGDTPSLGRFPDSVSARGAKHLRTLTERVQAGDRAVQLYVLSRSDLDTVTPARTIDPAYGRALDDAVAAGVEVLALRTRVTRAGVEPLGPGAVRL